jgi:Icc-related predicted phosphoesterase
MRIVLLSDTHGLHDRVVVPDGDILVHAGDLTPQGTLKEVMHVSGWLRSLPHKHKVVIAGNHDWLFERDPKLALEFLQGEGIVYLQDSEVTIEGLRFYGSPWQPWFCNWAFNVTRGALRPHWDKIPSGLDFLITHGPPMGILDQAAPHLGSEHVGCQELMEAIERAKPKYHVFGHLHGSSGIRRYENTTFINASVCNEAYQLANPPRVLEV